MIYYPDQKEKIKTWISLANHVRNPCSFPVNLKSGFLVVLFPPKISIEAKYPWQLQEAVLFLGEIPGMKGHGIFASQCGSVHWGYHLEDFRVIPEEEL
jgi:hypothetical protein